MSTSVPLPALSCPFCTPRGWTREDKLWTGAGVEFSCGHPHRHGFMGEEDVAVLIKNLGHTAPLGAKGFVFGAVRAGPGMICVTCHQQWRLVVFSYPGCGPYDQS